ncbi:hypothetical protein ACT7C8_01610 [Bacillus cereus]
MMYSIVTISESQLASIYEKLHQKAENHYHLFDTFDEVRLDIIIPFEMHGQMKYGRSDRVE